MYGTKSQKDDYDFCFNTFIHEMKIKDVIMTNQVSNIHFMSITVLRWCQLNIWTNVTYTCNLILTPQTTKDIRDPKYLPEFDMAVMQRSALPDQNFISVFLTFYKCALWYEILASFTNKVRTGNPEKGAITTWYLTGHTASGQRTWGQSKEPRGAIQ